MDTQPNTFRRFSAEDQGMMESPHNTPSKVRCLNMKQKTVVPRFDSRICHETLRLHFFTCNFHVHTFTSHVWSIGNVVVSFSPFLFIFTFKEYDGKSHPLIRNSTALSIDRTGNDRSNWQNRHSKSVAYAKKNFLLKMRSTIGQKSYDLWLNRHGYVLAYTIDGNVIRLPLMYCYYNIETRNFCPL